MTSKPVYFTCKFSLQKPISGARGRATQKGASLLFALLALVALSLAAIGLVRSVNTGTLVLGNLGFKQDTIRSADPATAAAVAWLRSNPLIQNADGAAGSGYYASTSALLDVTGRQLTATNRALVNWDGGNCSSAATGTYASCALVPGSAGTVNGNTAEYIIFRLCSAAGDPALDTTIVCSSPTTSSSSSTSKKGLLDYSDYARFTGAGGPFYRIVVKVSGARGTTSFTETIVHF